MPHMCTRCNNVFNEGSDILNGCPVCGWKKFLFVRSESDSSSLREVPAKKPNPKSKSLSWMLSVSKKDDRPGLSGESSPTKKKAGHEMPGSSDDFKEGDYIPNKDMPSKCVWEVEELLSAKENERKVESIRIEEPGTYELNLPKLLEREELVMAVKDGTYMIDLSSAFRRSKK